MNAYAEKNNENKSVSVANSLTTKKNCSKPNFQIIDNRPGAGRFNELQQIANNGRKLAKMNSVKPFPIQLNSQNKNSPIIQRMPILQVGGTDANVVSDILHGHHTPNKIETKFDPKSSHGPAGILWMYSFNNLKNQLHIHRRGFFDENVTYAAHFYNNDRSTNSRRYVVNENASPLFLKLTQKDTLHKKETEYAREHRILTPLQKLQQTEMVSRAKLEEQSELPSTFGRPKDPLEGFNHEDPRLWEGISPEEERQLNMLGYTRPNGK